MTYETLFHSQAEEAIQNALLAVLAHPEGINGLSVARLIGRGVDSAKSKLRELRRRGEIDRVCVLGNNWIWMDTALAKEFEVRRAESARARENECRERRRQYVAQRRKEDAENYAENPVVQRCIDARQAPSLLPAGPRWVFEVAGV